MLESISETLAKELDPDWNIHVTLIEPGAFATEAIQKSLDSMYSPPPGYEKPSLAGNVFRDMFKVENVLGDVAIKIMLGLDALTLRKEALAATIEDVREYES